MAVLLSGFVSQYSSDRYGCACSKRLVRLNPSHLSEDCDARIASKDAWIRASQQLRHRWRRSWTTDGNDRALDLQEALALNTFRHNGLGISRIALGERHGFCIDSVMDGWVSWSASCQC